MVDETGGAGGGQKRKKERTIHVATLESTYIYITAFQWSRDFFASCPHLFSNIFLPSFISSSFLLKSPRWEASEDKVVAWDRLSYWLYEPRRDVVVAQAGLRLKGDEVEDRMDGNSALKLASAQLMRMES